MAVCGRCGSANADGAKFCNECAAPLAAPAVETRKTVTVLFCDLVGSTALGERVDAEVLRSVMGGYHAELRRVLEQHGGTVEKFVGDAVMAVFGIPRVHEDDALRAVRAAWRMREASAGLGLEVRIGVNTGEVVVGEGETLVTGDAVNVAARLEQCAGTGQILVGSATEQLVRGHVELEEVDALTVKGKTLPVPAHLVMGVPDARGEEPLHASPLVGREKELALLEEALRLAREKRVPQLATVVGAPGVGKSRIVAELLGRSSARILVGRCLSYGDGITYWPVNEILAELGDVASVVGDDAVPVGTAMAAAQGASGATASPEEIAWAFRRVLESLSRDELVVVALEDIHWAEPALLDLIEYVATFAQDSALVLLCTARPELFDVQPTWTTPRPNATLVQLEPLSADNAASLALELAALPSDVLVRIVEASDGNPLFVEQLVAVHRESPSADLEVPPSLQALLAARIDRLETEERMVVERASVEGRLFHRGAVTALLPERNRPDAGRHLVGLVRRDLVRPDRATIRGDDGFRFGHILIRDAAYDSMSKRLRAELHEAYADWLVERLGDDAPLEIVGYHLEQAWLLRQELGQGSTALRDRAATVLADAGRAALFRHDMGAAGKHLDRALALTPQDPPRRHLLLDLAHVLYETGEPREVAVLEESIALARQAGDDHMRWLGELALVQNEMAHGVEGANDRARAVVDGVLESAPVDDHEVRATAWHVLQEVHGLTGEYEEGVAALDRAVHHARAGGLRRLETACASSLAGIVVYGHIPVPEGRQRIDELVERLGDDPSILGLAQHVRAHLAAREGDFEGAREAVIEWRDRFRELGQRRSYASTAGCVWDVCLLSGDVEGGEATLREGFELLTEMGDAAVGCTMAAHLGEAAYRRGRLDEAERLARESERLGDREDLLNEAMWRGVLAKVLSARGEHAAAEELIREAVDLTGHSGLIELAADSFSVLALVLRAAGDEAGAGAAAHEALDRYRRKGNLVRAAQLEEFVGG